MPTTYTITIRNASSAKQSFMLLQHVPKPATLPHSNVFTNVYMCTPQIAGNSTAKVQFQITDEYWAVFGTSQEIDDGRVKISTSDSRKATFRPDGSFFLLSTLKGDDGEPDGVSPFFKSEVPDATAHGAFNICTDGSFNVQNPGNIYLGTGLKDPRSGKIIPIQSYKARPNNFTQISPKTKYYIASGYLEPGTIVDMAELGQVLEIDFTDASGYHATFTLDTTNAYKPDDEIAASGIKWRHYDPIRPKEKL